MPRSPGQLSVELEAAALRAVRQSYDDLNHVFFKQHLRRPAFELSDSRSRLGQWRGDERVIELSRSLLEDHDWSTLIEVLKHEMAHQFVDEVLGLREEAPHGRAFREVCADRGIDSRVSGTPRGTDKSPEDIRLLERVSKLLALAESSNENEAQAAMSAAQRLMLKYNLDNVGKNPDYGFRQLGRATGRVSETERILACILGEYFFVEAIWVPVWRAREGKRGSVLEVCGGSANLELADYVYSFLMHTAERLWEEHKRLQQIRGNASRRTFQAGVMAGFRDKLASERRLRQREGLVWVGNSELDRYFRLRHPHVRITRHGGGRRDEAYAHGRRAGQKIVLHRGVSNGPSRRGPRLLGPA